MQRGSFLDRLMHVLGGGAPQVEDPRIADALAQAEAARDQAERRSEHLRLRTEVLRSELDRAGRRNEALADRLRALSPGEPDGDLAALRTRLAEVERERNDLAVQLARAEEIKAMLTDLGPLTLDELDQRMDARLAAIETRLAALRAGEDGQGAPGAA